MPINRSAAVRTDFPFLTRRPKPAASPDPVPAPETVPAPQTVPAPETVPVTAAGPSLSLPGPSLSLRRPAMPAPRPDNQPPAPRPDAQVPPSPSSRGVAPAPQAVAKPFPAPGIEEVRTLDEKTPLVRLSALQSAIGSLLVSGTSAVVWEATDLTTGARTAQSPDITGTAVQTSGNRLILDYLEDVAVVPLRHIGELRRALFIPKPGTTMLVEIYDGGSIAVPFDTTDPAAAAVPAGAEGSAGTARPAKPLQQILSLLCVGHQVELRAEPLPAGMDLQAIWEDFGFTLTESISASLQRS